MYHAPVFCTMAWLVSVDVNVHTFPEAPDKLKLVNVVVVPPVSLTVVAPVLEYVLVILANVLDPEMVKAPAPPWLTVQLYVLPPPVNVLADALVRLMVPVPVPAVVVKPVGNPLAKKPVVTIDPPLKVKFLVPVLVLTPASVRVLPFRSTVPFCRVAVPTMVTAELRAHSPPTPLNVVVYRLAPLAEIVFPVDVETKFNLTKSPPPPNAVPEARDIDPNTFMLAKVLVPVYGLNV
jgi:hypothetical protein